MECQKPQEDRAVKQVLPRRNSEILHCGVWWKWRGIIGVVMDTVLFVKHQACCSFGQGSNWGWKCCLPSSWCRIKESVVSLNSSSPACLHFLSIFRVSQDHKEQWILVVKLLVLVLECPFFFSSEIEYIVHRQSDHIAKFISYDSTWSLHSYFFTLKLWTCLVPFYNQVIYPVRMEYKINLWGHIHTPENDSRLGWTSVAPACTARWKRELPESQSFRFHRNLLKSQENMHAIKIYIQ